MIKNNPAVSVIVAMFNAEAYIGECLTSLENQTMQNFEIIIVDDCSTDNSCAVVENFFAKFGTRLKFAKLNQNSGRPGIPRNFALREAQGKYVYFLDSDDLLSETALAELYEVAEDFQADVVHCGRCLAFMTEGRQICADTVGFEEEPLVTKPTLESFDVASRLEGFVRKKFIWWACTKLFRRQFLLENKITFPAILDYEDFIFTLKCLVAAKNYVRVPFVNYFYRQRAASVSNKGYNVLELTDRLIETFRLLEGFMDGERFFQTNPRFRYAVTDFFMQMRLEILAHGFFDSNRNKPDEVYEILRQQIFVKPPSALTAYLFVALNKKILEVTN